MTWCSRRARRMLLSCPRRGSVDAPDFTRARKHEIRTEAAAGRRRTRVSCSSRHTSLSRILHSHTRTHFETHADTHIPADGHTHRHLPTQKYTQSHTYLGTPAKHPHKRSSTHTHTLKTPYTPLVELFFFRLQARSMAAKLKPCRLRFSCLLAVMLRMWLPRS